VIILGIFVSLASACVPVASNGLATASPTYVVTPRGNHLEATDPAMQSFQSELGFRAQPEHYLLDGYGKLIMKWVGAVQAEDFRTTFKQSLGE
jgi:hypothetical protein